MMRRIRVKKGRRPAGLTALGLASVLVVGACSGNGDTSGRSKAIEEPSLSTSSERTPMSKLIAQPRVGELNVASQRSRVDLRLPVFSNPTEITNPLFPVASQESVLLLGRVDGKEFRTEVTLLPDPRIIEWEGRQVATLVSQYVAFLDGRIHEVAYDFYAQADDGSVWYFGEDVFNFEDGVIADTHGTWIAGKDGPAAMIMPAEPQVGDVYRPENIPGFVFEEVTVESVGDLLTGPLHKLGGGLIIEELHMDGSKESKTFAPGYGEFYTSGGGDVEALALAVPTDAASEPLPAELQALESGWTTVFEAARARTWSTASVEVKRMAAAWTAYKVRGVPRRMEPRLTRSLETVADAVRAHDTQDARQSAIDTAQSILDLQLRYRPPAEIDIARFDPWLAQLIVDAGRKDASAINGDFFTLDYIRDRIMNALDAAAITRLNMQLEDLQGAVGDGHLAEAAKAAARLRNTLAEAAF
jgi:hypothetical protein